MSRFFHSSYFSLVFIMTENEVAPSEVFAETLIVQDILRKSSVAEEQETNRVPENELLEVSNMILLKRFLHLIFWKYSIK